MKKESVRGKFLKIRSFVNLFHGVTRGPTKKIGPDWFSRFDVSSKQSIYIEAKYIHRSIDRSIYIIPQF